MLEFDAEQICIKILPEVIARQETVVLGFLDSNVDGSGDRNRPSKIAYAYRLVGGC